MGTSHRKGDEYAESRQSITPTCDRDLVCGWQAVGRSFAGEAMLKQSPEG